MSKKMLVCCAFLLVMGWTLGAWGDVSGLVDKGLELYAQRTDPAKAKEAAVVLAQAVETEPDNIKAVEAYSIALYWLGEHLADKREREEAHAKGAAAAEKLIQAHPDSVVGYYRRGVHTVRILKLTRNTKLIDPVKEDMNKVLERDPGYEGGGANRVLGRLYFSLPWVMGGSNKKSIQNLTKAVELGPRQYLNHVYLAEVLIKEKKKDQARKLIDTVISGAPEEALQPEFQEWKARAEKMKSELE